MENRLVLILDTDNRIELKVKSLHKCNDPDLDVYDGYDIYSIVRGEPENALETAKKIVANTTGGLTKKDSSSTSEDEARLELYADTMSSVSDLFRKMGHKELAFSFDEFSQKLLNVAKTGADSYPMNVIFNKSGADDHHHPLTINTSDRDYERLVVDVRGKIVSMFNDIVERNIAISEHENTSNPPKEEYIMY